MHIYLNLTRPELMTAAGSVAGAMLGAIVHRLSLKYHIRLTRSEVAAAAIVVEALVPSLKAEVATVAAVVGASIPAPAAPPVEPVHGPDVVVNPIGFSPGARP